jgi:hypothetical protein
MSTHPIPTVKGPVVAALSALVEDQVVVHVVPTAEAIVANWECKGGVYERSVR